MRPSAKIFIHLSLSVFVFCNLALAKQFLTAPTYRAVTPNLIATGDINGDGRPDVVTAGEWISVLLAMPTRGFAPAKTFKSSGPATALRLADVNGDGPLDLVLGLSQGVAVAFGNGNATFHPPITYALSSCPLDVAVADMNNDQHLDIVVADRCSPPNGSVDILLNNGKGGFSAPVLYPVTTVPYSLTVADFNNDGTADVAVVCNDDDQVVVFLGQGNGTLGRAFVHYVDGLPVFIDSADMTQDGNIDLVVATYEGMDVLVGNGDGSFHSPKLTKARFNGRFVVKDFNYDGKADLAVIGDHSVSVNIVRGSGDGTFSKAINTYGFPGLSDIDVADFDGDKRWDLAVSDPINGDVIIMYGLDDGRFTAAESYYSPDSTLFTAAIADMNGDSIQDLILPTGDGILVYLGNGNGTFQLPKWSDGVGGTDAVAVADFDGDGKQDLAVPVGSQLTIVFGSGDGTFGRSDQYRTTNASWIVSSDFNGDGSPDLVLATDQGVAVLLNKGNGEFRTPVLYGFSTDLVALADLNNDGNVDIIFPGARIFVLLGNGDGTFQKPKAVGPPLQVFSISSGDFNHDGNTDLEVGAVDSVITLMGNGDGTFAPGHKYSIKNHSATVGDFNNDGNLDLAIARPYGAVTVLLGNGDGSFRESEDYYAGHDCYFIAIGDFNTDGSPDMAVVDSKAGLATVLMNTGAK